MAPAGCFDHYLIAEIMIETSSLGSGWRGCMWVRTWHSHAVSFWTADNCEPNAGARCAVPTQQAQRERERERGGLMSCANMPPHVEVSLRKGVCVSVYVCINPWACENVLYRDLCVTVSYGVGGHSTVHAKCDLIYGSGTGEWVEWEWTGCPRTERSFCSNALSDHLFRIMWILPTFKLTAGYGHR